MKAIFLELAAFARHRQEHMDDLAFSAFQAMLMINPHAGARIKGTGGLRKVRFADSTRQTGTRGGVRILYFWWNTSLEFWLFTIYAKNIKDALSPDETRALKAAIKRELAARGDHLTELEDKT